VSEEIKRMADLLRSGATMLSEACPKCNAPLFKLPSGEVYCATCNQKVVIVPEGKEAAETVAPSTLGALEETMLLKLQEVERKIKTGELEGLQSTVNLANALLEGLEKVRKLRKTR